MNRRALVLAGLAALPGAVLVSPVSAKPRRAARQRSSALRANHARFRVVNRTFTNNLPITIPDSGAATPYPAILQVGGLRAGKILDVNVTLRGLSHTDPNDLDIILVAPNGRTSVVLTSQNGGDFDIVNVTLVFDDQAVGFLPDDDQIVSGSFKPTMPGEAPTPETASLRAFNGLNPNGAWRLYVADQDSGNEGSIASWALTLRARVQVPHRHRRRANRRQRPARRAKR